MTIAADQEIAPSYDRESTIIAMVTARAWRDPDYKARLLSDPRAVLADEGLEFPASTEVRAVADTPDLRHIFIPAQGDTSQMTHTPHGTRSSTEPAVVLIAPVAVTVINSPANTLSVATMTSP